MSKYSTSHPYKKAAPFPKNNPPKQGDGTPFKIVGLTIQPEKIRINSNSMAFLEPNLSSKVPIIGLDCPIEVEYGNKIWIEFFYDRTLTPLLGVVKVGNKWAYKTANTANKTELVNVYPSEFEFISKYDVENNSKLNEIQETIDYIEELRTLQEEEINFRFNYLFINEDEKNEYLVSMSEDFDIAVELLEDLKNNLSSYFGGSPTAIWKKLFRSFLLVGYSTKNLDKDRPGVDFFIPEDTIQENPEVPVAAESKNYRIIQCWNNDILFVDGIYQNRFPVKYPTIFHRGVSYFLIDGDEEEQTLTV